jgi:hypothetical protein
MKFEVLLVVNARRLSRIHTFYIFSTLHRFKPPVPTCANIKTMRGQKTDPRIVNEIDQLRKTHRHAEIVGMMEGCVSRRMVYRILHRLKEKDAIQARESEKAIVEDRWQEIRERLYSWSYGWSRSFPLWSRSHFPACPLWTGLCSLWGRIRGAFLTLGLVD